ncbi:hypothetical protein WMY93_002678 [Mugilogobius chulae]|uniref:Uncharacterized protein n=1 Tax=Mugilogobius chulae TaxID=88201 RepID=A0AAW0Q4C7_9GOBI
MSTSPDEPVCPKFQPNIFDPSRCHDCLRQRHLHSGAGESTVIAPHEKSTLQARAENKIDISHKIENGTENYIGHSKGVLLTPIPSQGEEKDTSSKETSDSVVSSYCDVGGGQTGYKESSLCILSPDCALYICAGDDDRSTVSSRDHSDYQEFSSSISTEDEYLPVQHHSSHLAMTRLDPPPHRPNPRAWMDEARSRDAFSSHSSLKENKGKRESGYFSLGRASGAGTIRDKSPASPYRHIERGHPVFNLRNVEPKDAVPFRNPNLGVASERLIPEPAIEDEPIEIIPPDPYDLAVEVEAQVGPRSPSPTPFKIAESLASTVRKGTSSSYGRRSPPQINSYQSSRQASALQSRSASPSRGSFAFRRSESTTSLNRHNFDGGGRSKRTEITSKSSFQSASERRGDFGTMPRNFKSSASALKTQANTVSDFRNALRKSEGNVIVNGRVKPSRNSSPTRGDYNPRGQMSLRGMEANSSKSYVRNREVHASSPTQRSADNARNKRSASLPRRNHDTPNHSVLRKSESIWSLNGRGHPGRCGSPVREGYDIESQALIRDQISNYGVNEDEDERPCVSPLPKSLEMPSKSVLRKTDPENSIRGLESRSSSPGRRGFNSSSQLRRTNTSGSLYSQDNESRSSSRRQGFDSSHHLQRMDTGGSLYRRGESRNSSPARRNYDTSPHSLSRKAVGNTSDRNINRSTSPYRRSDDPPEPRPLRAAEGIVRSHSPPQRGLRDPPGYSVLRNATNGDLSLSSQRKEKETKSETNHSSRSWRESAHANHSSISRASSPSRQSTTGNRGSMKSQSSRAWSPSPSQVDLRRHTSSQSSMESSESGQLSVDSKRRNREEYAIMADLPKVKKVQQREGLSQPERTNIQLFKPAR